jgi:branched-chain amino acid transport system permease protein
MFFQQFLNSFPMDSPCALIALDDTLIYGTLGFVSSARGEVYLIGASLAIFVLWFLNRCDLDQWTMAQFLVITFYLACSAAFGAVTEIIACKPLQKSPRMSPRISVLGALF